MRLRLGHDEEGTHLRVSDLYQCISWYDVQFEIVPSIPNETLNPTP